MLCRTKQVVVDFTTSRRTDDYSNPSPMDVDAIQKGDIGKHKNLRRGQARTRIIRGNGRLRFLGGFGLLGKGRGKEAEGDIAKDQD